MSTIIITVIITIIIIAVIIVTVITAIIADWKSKVPKQVHSVSVSSMIVYTCLSLVV